MLCSMIFYCIFFRLHQHTSQDSYKGFAHWPSSWEVVQTWHLSSAVWTHHFAPIISYATSLGGSSVVQDYLPIEQRQFTYLYHLGEPSAAWWWVWRQCAQPKLLNHLKLLISSFWSCTRSHSHKKHNPKWRKIFLPNSGWAHTCHTHVTKLLGVLQDGSPQISNFGLL